MGWVARFDTADDPVTQVEVTARGSFTGTGNDRGVFLSDTQQVLTGHRSTGPVYTAGSSRKIRLPQVVGVRAAGSRLCTAEGFSLKY